MALKLKDYTEANELKDVTKNAGYDGALKRSRAMNNLLEDNLEGTASDIRLRSDFQNIPLSEICGRYENLYIIEPDTIAGLMKSIEKEGLLQPISIVDIRTYLKNKANITGEEKEYLDRKLEEGFKYFIDIGHSRFRAMMSLALGRQLMTRKELDEAYEELKNSTEVNRKYSKINARVTMEIGYDSSNIQSRRTTNYEIAMSIHKHILNNNLEKELSEKYQATDRQGMAYLIRCFALEEYNKDIAESGIRNYLKIDELFSDEMKQFILDGKLALRDAQSLLSIYPTIVSENGLDELYSDIESGKFNFKKYKEKYGKKLANNPGSAYSKSDLIRFIYEIKRGSKTIDQVIKLLEKTEL